MSISEQINQIVSERGIKQSYIAQKTGMTADTVSKVLNGKRRMTADVFLSLCFMLEIDPKTITVPEVNENA